MSLPVQVRGTNASAMASLVAKLLLLLSVLLMPLAMAPAASAPAELASMSHESMGHCPDPPVQDFEPGIAACTMACAAALPAIGPCATAPLVKVAAPLAVMPPKALEGILLEIATPPPRPA